MSEMTKKCKHCQSDIPKKAKVCPVCRRRLNHPVLGTFLLIFGLIIAISAFSSMWNGDSSSTTASSGASSQEKPSRQETKKDYITLDDFNSIETGMSYEEVVAIIGYEGTVLSEVEVMDSKSTMYCWYGKDGISNANVTVSNGKVMSKAQLGLK